MVPPRQLAAEEVPAPLALGTEITKGKVVPQLPVPQLFSNHPLLTNPRFDGPVALPSTAIFLVWWHSWNRLGTQAAKTKLSLSMFCYQLESWNGWRAKLHCSLVNNATKVGTSGVSHFALPRDNQLEVKRKVRVTSFPAPLAHRIWLPPDSWF